MATVLRVSFCFFCGEHLWCQVSKTFLKTTEHSWTKTILSTGVRRKLFNSSLMNKLMGIEWVGKWVSEWAPFDCPLSSLMDVTSSKSKNWKMMFQCKMTNRKYRFESIFLENPRIDPGTCRMLSGRSTIWANRPFAAKPSRDLPFVKLWAATLRMSEMEKACRKHQNGQVWSPWCREYYVNTGGRMSWL